MFASLESPSLTTLKTAPHACDQARRTRVTWGAAHACTGTLHSLRSRACGVNLFLSDMKGFPSVYIIIFLWILLKFWDMMDWAKTTWAG
jgi:hypothetical protein